MSHSPMSVLSRVHPRPVGHNTGYCTKLLSLDSTTLTGWSATNYTWQNTLKIHVAPAGGIADLRFVYANFNLGGTQSSEAPGPNTIYVQASVSINGVIFPLYFAGARQVAIDGGGIAISDPVGAEVAAGSWYKSRTNVWVANGGQKWPLNRVINSALGEWIVYGTGATVDYTTATSIPSAVNGIGYCPVSVLGAASSTLSSVCIIGDSRAVASADAADGIGQSGYLEKAFSAALVPQVAWANNSVEGAALFALLQNRSATTRLLGQGYTHLVDQLGINDVLTGQTLAQIQANKATLWALAQQRGMKVIATTIEPHTTGAWASAGGQAIPFAGQETIRTGLNDWIRSKPAPLVGYWEVADTLETARNSGIWTSPGNVAQTNDGLHANAAGTGLAKTAINMSLLAL